MIFQIIFSNRNWKNASQGINFLEHVKWFLVGGYRYYDPPKVEKDGGGLLAEMSRPIWIRFYYRWIWKIYKKFKPKSSGQLNELCSEKGK